MNTSLRTLDTSLSVIKIKRSWVIAAGGIVPVSHKMRTREDAERELLRAPKFYAYRAESPAVTGILRSKLGI